MIKIVWSETMTKTLISQLSDGVSDYAIHINRETIEQWIGKISKPENSESVADYVFRVALSEAAKSLIVAKKESGAGELNNVMKCAIANGMTKRHMASILRDLINNK
jgi:hypothetical protein